MQCVRLIRIATVLWLTVLAQVSLADVARITVPDGTERSYSAGTKTLDLLFEDGSSLLLGPGGVVAVTSGARLSLQVSEAVLRIATGQPGRARLIDITTPTAKLKLSDGAAVLDVTEAASEISMLLPGRLEIEAAGRSGLLYRAGFSVIAEANRLNRARRTPLDRVAAQLNRIAPGLGPDLTVSLDPKTAVPVQVSQSAQSGAAPLPNEVGTQVGLDDLGISNGQGECTGANDGEAGVACRREEETVEVALLDASFANDTLQNIEVSIDTPETDNPVSGNPGVGTPGTGTPGGGTPGSQQPDPLASFADGFGGLGLADLDDPNVWVLSTLAAAGTSISDDNVGNTPNVFQAFGEPYDFSTFLNAITVAEQSAGGAFSDDIQQFLADEIVFFTPEGFFLDFPSSEEASFLLRAHSAGPTTTLLLPGAWETDYLPGENDSFSSYNAQLSNGQLTYVYGFPGSETSDQTIALTSSPRSTSFSGDFVFRRADAETTSLGTSVDESNIFRLASVRSARIEPFFEEGTLTILGDEVVGYFNDDDGQIAGFALDYGGPFSGRQDDSFLLFDLLEVQPLADPSNIDPDLVFTQLGSGFSEDPDTGATNGSVIVVPDYRTKYAAVPGGQRMVFATGDLDGMLSGDAEFGYSLNFNLDAPRVDHFQLNTGLLPAFATDAFSGDLAELAHFSDSRAFLPALSWTDMFTSDGDLADVTQSPLYVVHPASPVVKVDGLAGAAPGTVVAGGVNSRLLHLDFGLEYENGRQVSAISATLGEVGFRLYRESQAEGYTLQSLVDSAGSSEPVRYLNYSVDALLTATTVGSSNDGQNAASTLWQSSWNSSAAGGGNPLIGESGGQLGFFVLQNAGPRYDDVVSGNGDVLSDLPGGRASPMGDDPVGHPDLAFSALRLGIGVAANQGGERTGAGLIDGLVGYASGFVEAEAAGADVVALYPGARIDDGPNLVIYGLDRNESTLSATLAFDGQNIAFGADAAALSTYADDLTWGVLSGGETIMALASLDPVASELRGQFKDTAGADVPIPGTSTDGAIGDGSDAPYKYVQWGAFFGDTVTTDQARRHVHLGTFAATSPIDRSVLDRATGEATYTGHAIGNVYNAGDVYTAAGRYSDTFNFDRRRGETMLDFDGRDYRGTSQLANGRYRARVEAGDRAGAMAGQFGGGTTNGRPNAVVGGFEIANSATNPNAAYRASGTFAGEVGR